MVISINSDLSEKNNRIFIGWWTALATGVIWFFCYGTWSYSFGTYVTPLIEEFGWSRAQVSAASSLRMVEGGVGGPIDGYLVDKYGPKKVCLTGLTIAGLGLISLFFMNALWQWWLIWGFFVSLGFNFGLGIPLTKSLVDWFMKKRGLALGIAKLLMGLGGNAMPIIMTFLLIQYGWRTAFLVSGIAILIISLPLVWLFVRPYRPEYYGFLPDGVKADVDTNDEKALIEAGQKYAAEVFDEREYTLRQAIKTKAFWAFAITKAFTSFVSPAVMVHGVPHMISMGISAEAAATAIGITFGLGAPVRLIGGYIVDRLSTRQMKWMWILAYISEVIGFIFLLRATTLSMIYIFVAFWGIGFGLNHPIGPPIYGRYFGRKGYGTITGAMTTIGLPASVIAPIYIGWIFDVTGSYLNAYLHTTILLVMAILVMVVFLQPPKERPEVISDLTTIL